MENDGEARTATVTLSAAGVEDVVVTFNQAANQSTMPGTGAGTEASPYDIARAYAVIDAANGGTVSGVYVKGIISYPGGYTGCKPKEGCGWSFTWIS